MPRKLTREEFIQKSRLLHGNKYDYSILEFVNVRGKVKFMKDGEIYEQFAYAHLQGKSPERAPFKITNDEFIKRSIEIHGDMFDYSLVDCNGSHSKIKIIHNGKIYHQILNDHIRGNIPRGIIVDSKGVREILKFIDEKKINFKREHFYKDCKNIKYLRFDFYLIDYDILIEYDGQQHFKSIEHWGGDEEFKKRKINDSIKEEYCKNNRIPLLRISYNDNILEKLSEFLSKYCI
jgi:very-short-patch-repair endonuclease